MSPKGRDIDKTYSKNKNKNDSNLLKQQTCQIYWTDETQKMYKWKKNVEFKLKAAEMF